MVIIEGHTRAFLVAQSVKNLPAMQETWVQSLGWEDPWRREWQPTPVFLPGDSPWIEEPGGLQSMSSQSQTCLSDYARLGTNHTDQGSPGGASSKESACQSRKPETGVQSLGWEDPVEKEMATHSSIVA